MKGGIQDLRDTGKEGSGKEGCGTGEKLDRRDTVKEGSRKLGMKETRDSGLEGYMKGGTQDQGDTGKKGYRKGGKQERRVQNRIYAEQERYCTGGIQERWNAGQVGP